MNTVNKNKRHVGSEGELRVALEGWLREKSTVREEFVAKVAQGISGSLMQRYSETMLQKHIPLKVFQLVENGLMTIPLAPIYEAHRLMCPTCARNYAYVKEHRGLVTTLRKAKDDRWVQRSRAERLYRTRLLDALETSNEICAVSGEVILDVFDSELCDRMRDYAKKGGRFSMIAGPFVEKHAGKDGVSDFAELLNEGNRNICFFKADRRQELHFAYSDTIGIIYVELPHDSMVDSREYLFGGSVEDGKMINYVHDRFNASFASPDVKLYRSSDDVMLAEEDEITKVTQAARASGLDTFGRFGMEAQRMILSEVDG